MTVAVVVVAVVGEKNSKKEVSTAHFIFGLDLMTTPSRQNNTTMYFFFFLFFLSRHFLFCWSLLTGERRMEKHKRKKNKKKSFVYSFSSFCYDELNSERGCE